MRCIQNRPTLFAQRINFMVEMAVNVGEKGF